MKLETIGEIDMIFVSYIDFSFIIRTQFTHRMHLSLRLKINLIDGSHFIIEFYL